MGRNRMKRVMSRFFPVMAAALLLAAVLPAQATVLFQSLGTAAPPATLGGLPMTPFVQLPGAGCYDFYTTIPGCPIPGAMTVSPAIGQTKVGTCWASWSHGYTGDIYWSNGATAVTLTLPSGATAFYLYVEPNPFNVFNITATTNSGATSGAIPVNGAGGATGFAFYTDAADTIATITVSSSVDFALGEFGISNTVTFDRSFMDDKGRSQFCVNTHSGNYQWSILSGPGAPFTFNGQVQVLNGGTLFVSFPSDPNAVYLVYDVLRHKANGYFYGSPYLIDRKAQAPELISQVYSPLVDKNTNNDPPCITGGPTEESQPATATGEPESVTPPAFGTSFMDDKGRSQFCVDPQTGFYQWFVLSGPGAYAILRGQLQVLNGGTLFVSFPTDPNAVYLVYDVKKRKANGYFYGSSYDPRGTNTAPELGVQIYSPLVDKNTANDPPCGYGGGS